MRLYSKVQLQMDDATRLRHLYRGLRPESDAFHIPDEFLQELVRLERLQKVSDASSATDATFMISQYSDSSRINDRQASVYDRSTSKQSHEQRSQTAFRTDRTARVDHSSGNPRHQQASSLGHSNRHLNEW